MKHRILTLALAAFMSAALNAAPALWTRNPSISPDGSRIAFTYKGDIYTAAAAGGTAVRITSDGSYNTQPVWSPDGKTIAFASDRFGRMDIFAVSSEGGPALRLTTHSASETPICFSRDGKYVYFAAHIQRDAASAQISKSYISEFYRVALREGARPEKVSSAVVRAASFAGGGSFLYESTGSQENAFRKHHTSAAAHDLFYYDAEKATHTLVFLHKGEDRNPVFLPGSNKDFVFLSERAGGSFNVYRSSLGSSKEPERITNFKTNPVRSLSVASNGTLCFGYMGEIYTMTSGRGGSYSAPRKVSIEVVSDAVEAPVWGTHGNISDVAYSADGSLVAVVSRGEIFVTSDEYSTSRRITNTAAAELQPAFSPDKKTLAYTSERDGYNTIYLATYADTTAPSFVYASYIKEERLFKNDGIERSQPAFSPNGKELAFVEARRILKVIDLKTKKERVIVPAKYETSTALESFAYSWSPDGKWFALEANTNGHYPYSNIAIVSAEGGAELHNITSTGYFAQSPVWVMGGNAIVFTSDIYGMRNHASWGSQEDAFVAFLNQKTYDNFLLSKEDASLVKKDTTKSKTIAVELEGLQDRVVRMTPMSSRLSGAILDSKGENFYFLAAFEKGYDLWKLEVRTRDLKNFAKNVGSGSLSFDKKGGNILLSGRSPKKIDAKSGKITNISYEAAFALDKAAEREYMYNHVLLQQQKRFFRTDDNGCDFAAVHKSYAPFLSHINNNYDFSELLSEVLGELNVSHSGSGYRKPAGRGDDATASLGLLINDKVDLIVEEVVTGGPFDRKDSKVKAGDVIVAIDGTEIARGADYYPLLNHKSGQWTTVTFSRDGKKWDERIKPIGQSKFEDLLYERWVKRNEALVEKLSGGRLGYVHIQGMSDPSFRVMYSKMLGELNGKEGVVVDTRFNGGGRMHEDIEIFLSGEKYLEQTIKGEAMCDMPSRRYNKPTVMVTGEANYSNAHGTPWVYRYKGIGKIVGMPVPGTMSSVTWEDLQDPTVYFGLPVVGYRTAEGEYLENQQLEPDVLVRNTVETLDKGRDLQLEAAVEVLLKEVSAKKSW